MIYKTICLRLLEDRPNLYEQLRQSRTVLTTLNCLAGELWISHETWMNHLMTANQTTDPSQISIEVMELALKEQVDSLPSESPTDDEPTPDAATAFVTRPTLHA
jgi:hypothetical protein